MRLGKLPYRDDARTLQLARYIDHVALPAVPASVHRANLVPAWPMYLNDELGDCTCAEVGHAEQLFSTMNGHEIQVLDGDVLKLYRTVSGYNPSTGANDNGAVILDVMKTWRTSGCGGHKIGAFAEVDLDDDHLLRAAIYLFGGVSVGLALPLELEQKVQGGNSATWTKPRDLTTAQNRPGGWGGHCVLITDYDAHGLTCVTWGRLQRMSWAFWHAYGDEAWAALSSEWIARGKTAPTGVNITALQADLNLVAA